MSAADTMLSPGRSRAWLPIGVVAALLVAWELSVQLSARPVMASPNQILVALVGDAQLYLNAALTTFGVAVRGWVWGTAFATALAGLFVVFRPAEFILQRLALTVFCLPLVAVLPLLQLTFDPDTAKVVLSALSMFFTSLVGAVLGFRSADSQALTMVHAWGGGSTAQLRFVRARAALPAILTAMQIGAPAAVLGAIFGEFIGSTRGVGVLVVNGLTTLNFSQVWAAAVVATAMSTIAYYGFGLLKRRFASWSSEISVGSLSRGPQPRGWHGVLLVLMDMLLSLVVLVVAWWLFLLLFNVSPFVGKTPPDVVAYLLDTPNAVEIRAQIASALWITLMHAGIGYVAGMVLGISIGILFSTRPAVEAALAPIVIALRSVPIIILTPILIPIFGRGLVGVAVIVAIVSFFPTLANTQHGLSRVPTQALLLMRSYGASAFNVLLRVKLPYALPSIFASARIAAPSAVLAASLAEWLAAGSGLGHYIMLMRSTYAYAGLWSGAMILTVVSLIFYALVGVAERAVLARFAPEQQG
jgi:sulfonate transport system permease protein